MIKNNSQYSSFKFVENIWQYRITVLKPKTLLEIFLTISIHKLVAKMTLIIPVIKSLWYIKGAKHSLKLKETKMWGGWFTNITQLQDLCIRSRMDPLSFRLPLSKLLEAVINRRKEDTFWNEDEIPTDNYFD